MTRKFKNKTLPKGIMIDRGYVWINIYPNGKLFKRCLGPVTQTGVIDDAIAKLNDLRQKIRLGKFQIEEEEKRLTMDNAVEIFWDLHASKKLGARVFRYQLNHLKKFFEGKWVDTLTDLDWRDYRHKREIQDKKRPTTVNREQTVMTTLFNKLKEWKKKGRISNIRLPEFNPTYGVKDADERPYARKRIVTPEEFQRFMEVAPMSVKRICLAAINTTLRFKSLKALTKENIHEAANVFGGTQSKVQKLYQVPINGPMQTLIDTAEGDKIFDFTNFDKLFKEARKKSGLSFQFRDLRRSGARMMLQKGMDIATVSRYLGHSDIKTTQIYLNPTQEDLQIAGQVLGSMYCYNLIPSTTKNTTKDNFTDSEKQAKVTVSK